VADDFAALLGSGLRIGFESTHLPHAAWQRLDEAAREAGSELVPTTMLVERLRAVKSPAEIERIRRGAALTDEVYGWLVDSGLAGRSERELVFAIEQRFHEQGATAAFAPIVAAGPNGAAPHAEPGDGDVPRQTLVVLDLGAAVDGYCSDCTRTVATGATTDEMKEVYEIVLRAQEAALALVGPGRPCPDVHAEARRVIAEAGYGEFFNHGTGHGVGIDIHEEPRFRAGFGGVLAPGNVVTVEPGIYLPDRFGVRIEDLVVVTEDGHEVLSQFPKSLVDAGG
jgi:Xaa-Pro aminopeptidase